MGLLALLSCQPSPAEAPQEVVVPASSPPYVPDQAEDATAQAPKEVASKDLLNSCVDSCVFARQMEAVAIEAIVQQCFAQCSEVR
jgi:hypothetical protein